MYPVEPGSGQLVLGSPLFEQTVVRPSQGKPTTLDAPKAATRPYIDQAAWTSLDGRVSKGTLRSFVTTQQLRQGGTLNLKMSDKPGDRFGVKPEDRPTSLWESPGFLAVPGIEAPRTFQSESAAFQLQHIQPDAVLSYSVNARCTPVFSALYSWYATSAQANSKLPFARCRRGEWRPVSGACAVCTVTVFHVSITYSTV